MEKLIKILIVLLLPSFLFINCGADTKSAEKTETVKVEKSDKKSNNPFSDLQKAAEQMEKVMNGEDVDIDIADPVNFRELKKLLPEDFNGFERTEASGSTQGVMGVNVSQAEGKYKNDDASLKINIVDVGGMKMALMGLASWAKIDMDKESDNGYERTTEIDGHKAYEKFNTKNNSGELAVLVDGRYIVTINGRNITEKQLKKAKNKIDFKDLIKLGK